jgi:5-methylcytosine-specific restriction endonuclease McrA
MAVKRRVGNVRRTVETRRRDVRGYAASRQAYDARRRRRTRDSDDKAYWALVQRDPCSYCGRPAGPAQHVDHIDGLNSDRGLDVWTNYTAACPDCNRRKRDRSALLFMLARVRARDDDAPQAP